MTDDRSLERAARSWLEEGPTRAPDRPVELALAQILSTPQQRDLRVPWRNTQLPPLAKLAAAAVVVVAVGGAFVTISRTGPSAGSSPTPQVSPSASPAPSLADELADYRIARDRICVTAAAAFSANTDLVGLYEESTPPDRRAIVNANAQEITDAVATMATDLGQLDPPAALAHAHTADVAHAQNQAAILSVWMQALRDGRLSDARALELALEAASNLRRPFEEANDLFNCP